MKWNINNFLEIYGSITFGPTITWTKTMSYLNYFQKKKITGKSMKNKAKNVEGKKKKKNLS